MHLCRSSFPAVTNQAALRLVRFLWNLDSNHFIIFHIGKSIYFHDSANNGKVSLQVQNFGKRVIEIDGSPPPYLKLSKQQTHFLVSVNRFYDTPVTTNRGAMCAAPPGVMHRGWRVRRQLEGAAWAANGVSMKGGWWEGGSRGGLPGKSNVPGKNWELGTVCHWKGTPIHL